MIINIKQFFYIFLMKYDNLLIISYFKMYFMGHFMGPIFYAMNRLEFYT